MWLVPKTGRKLGERARGVLEARHRDIGLGNVGERERNEMKQKQRLIARLRST